MPENPPDQINAQLVQVAVYMGDHAETVPRFVEVDPDESVRSLLERLLPASTPYKERDYDNHVILAFAQPIPTPEEGVEPSGEVPSI